MGKGERSRSETQAHNVSGSPQEDRGGTAGKVGEVEGGEEAVASFHGRGSQARTIDCGEHPSRSEAGAVRWRAEGASDSQRDCGCGAVG